MTISEKKIITDYEKIKKLAKNSFKKKSYNKCSKYIDYAASLMYNVNLFYTDDELENLLKSLSLKIDVNGENNFQNNKIIFYDYFVLDNRGLTEQFLDAFNILGYKIVFITSVKKTYKSQILFDKLSKNTNIEICDLASDKPMSKAKEIVEAVYKSGAKKIICHTSPWDVPLMIALNKMEGFVERYLSNITDHAFWLGSKCFDYYFEFRSYGYNISTKERRIDSNKLLYLPYYPIINKLIPFNGINFNLVGKKLVLSGGSKYKTEGGTKYLKIVKYILDNYPDTIFLFLGKGNFSDFHKFIKDNSYEQRFFIADERKDLFRVFEKSFLYLNTYPLIGGLMTQFACVTGIPPLTLNDNNDHCNDVKELMPNIDSKEIVSDNMQKIEALIDTLFSNNEKYLEISSLIKKAVISKEKYASLLDEYLNKHENKIEFKKYFIDTKAFYTTYIIRLNQNKAKGYISLFLKKDACFALHFFQYFLKAFCIKLFNKLIKSK